MKRIEKMVTKEQYNKMLASIEWKYYEAVAAPYSKMERLILAINKAREIVQDLMYLDDWFFSDACDAAEEMQELLQRKRKGLSHVEQVALVAFLTTKVQKDNCSWDFPDVYDVFLAFDDTERRMKKHLPIYVRYICEGSKEPQKFRVV